MGAGKTDVSRLEAKVKEDILSSVARELEFTVHSLCRTEDGYRERAEEKVRAVRALARAEVWVGAGAGASAGRDDEELEDAREVVDVVRRVCQRAQNGKIRVG